MSRFALFACAALVLACAKQENAASSDSSALAVAAATPGGVSIADFAGMWSVKAMPENSDSTLVTYDLMASNDTTSWMMHLPDGQAIPLRIMAVAGDSVMADAGPYNSVLRKGVKVSTNAVLRLQGGMVKGTFVAHYTGAGVGADSVMRGRLEGTKKP